MCDSTQGDRREAAFAEATLHRPPEVDCPGLRRFQPFTAENRGYNRSVVCDQDWPLRLIAEYQIGCVPDWTAWDMDDYPDNIGQRSSDIISPYEARDDIGAPISRRSTLEIMRELYPDDPLLIRAVRTGSEARHIYERDSSPKQTLVELGAYGVHPAFHVRARTAWRYTVSFFYTMRQKPSECKETKDINLDASCPDDAPSNTSPFNEKWSQKDDYEEDTNQPTPTVVHRRRYCVRDTYRSDLVSESPPYLFRVLGGYVFCNRVREREASNDRCDGVYIPVRQVFRHNDRLRSLKPQRYGDLIIRLHRFFGTTTA